jgi:hypothetical protein
MLIVIEDNKPVVKLRAGEIKSLLEAQRVSGEIAEWLGDEVAERAFTALVEVNKRFVKGSAEVAPPPAAVPAPVVEDVEDVP